MRNTMAVGAPQKAEFTQEQIERFYSVFAHEVEMGKVIASDLKKRKIKLSEYTAYSNFVSIVNQHFPDYDNNCPTLDQVEKIVCTQEEPVTHNQKKFCSML